MRISQAGIDLIKQREGIRLKALLFCRQVGVPPRHAVKKLAHLSSGQTILHSEHLAGLACFRGSPNLGDYIVGQSRAPISRAAIGCPMLHAVSLVFFRRCPAQVARRVVSFAAVVVRYLMGWRRPGAVESRTNKYMDQRSPLSPTRDVRGLGENGGWVTVLQAGSFADPADIGVSPRKGAPDAPKVADLIWPAINGTPLFRGVFHPSIIAGR